MRILIPIAIGLLIACGGSECGDFGLDIPAGSRMKVDFRIHLELQHATEEKILEPQEVTVTSWRGPHGATTVDQDSLVETRHFTNGTGYTAIVKVTREYYFSRDERIYFKVLSTGATTQASREFNYTLNHASPLSIATLDERVIEDAFLIYCRNIQ